MAKKFSLLLAAVAVLAFAAPSMAFAGNPELTVETLGGIRDVSPPGAAIEGTGTNVILTSSTLGEIKCAKLNLVAELTKNSGGEVIASGAEETNPFQETCLDGKKAVRVTNVHVTNIHTTAAENTGTPESERVGHASFTSKVDVGPVGEETTCNVTGSNVEFRYATNTDKITFTSATGLTAAGCGTLKLDATFTLEVPVGNPPEQRPVFID
jgi:hypothetical protein